MIVTVPEGTLSQEWILELPGKRGYDDGQIGPAVMSMCGLFLLLEGDGSFQKCNLWLCPIIPHEPVAYVAIQNVGTADYKMVVARNFR